MNPDLKVLTKTLRAGDNVRITTHKGVTLELTVQEISDNQITGQHEKVAIPDIAMIEKQEFSPIRTAGFITVGVAATLVVLLLVMFHIFAPMAGP